MVCSSSSTKDLSEKYFGKIAFAWTINPTDIQQYSRCMTHDSDDSRLTREQDPPRSSKPNSCPKKDWDLSVLTHTKILSRKKLLYLRIKIIIQNITY